MIRTYSELRRLSTFEERYAYLRLGGSVGHRTFGFDRYINQSFYHSREWKDARNVVIVRDNGCDLGVIGYEIHGDLLVHHINPINADDIQHNVGALFDPEFLITTTNATHNAIHYGDQSLLAKPLRPRSAGDTKLW